MSSACKLIPAPDDSVARIAIVLHSSSKTIKNARVWGCLLNTSVTMHWINPRDHHMKVIKLPSSIMNGTISRDSGLLLWQGWMGEKIAGEEVLCSATLVSCCRDDDYGDNGDDDGDVSVCKSSLLEGVIVTHVSIFPGMWDERNWHLLLMTNPRSLFFLTEFESFGFCLCCAALFSLALGYREAAMHYVWVLTHRPVSPCWCCFWNIVVDVAPGPPLQPADKFSWCAKASKHWAKDRTKICPSVIFFSFSD